MNPVRFAKLCRYGIADATTFPDADVLDLANTFKDEIAALIVKEVDEGYFQIPSVRDLVVSQREYDLPIDMLGHFDYITAMLDGINTDRLNEADLSWFKRGLDEADIEQRYMNKKPEFIKLDQSIFILSQNPIIAVPGGLTMWGAAFPADFANLTDTADMSNNPSPTTHGFPRQFHELLVRRVRIEWKNAKDRPIALTEREKNYEVDLMREIENLKDENRDRAASPKVPYDDGSQY